MLLFVTFLVVLFFYFSIRYFKLCNYWKNKGVKCLQPLPLIGNSLPVLMQNVTITDFVINLYNAFPNERYCGIYQFEEPILLIRDVELIKKIAIKDFDSFTDHSTMGEEIDSLWGKNLFASRGNRWKNLRQTLSPVFTSSKIKSMFHLIEQITEQLTDYLNEQKGDVVEVELNDVIKKFAIDAIASTAFGIESNSLKKEDNEFYKMGMELTDLTGWKKFNLMLYNLNPVLAKILNIKMISKRVGEFFSSIIKYTMEARTKNNIYRPDLIHLLMEARKGKLKFEETNQYDGFSTAKETYTNKTNAKFIMSDEDIYSQSIIFFFGGFDTSSTMINFCIYEMVANTDIQEKLRNEVDAYVEECDGKISYEGLFQLKYLDMVISETLRKWSVVSFLDRKTIKSFTIEPETKDEVPVHLNRGDVCWIPMFPVHRDPTYWPNPDVFDPERFSEENRQKIKSGTYYPFGIGPRNCIGSRYALLIAKLLIFNVVANFEIVPVSKTVIPLVLRKNSFLLKPVHDFWFGFKKRRASNTQLKT